jgi:hypothetical protein
MLSRVVPLTPTVCPVPIEVLRRHIRIDQGEDDELLQIYATAATDIAESACNRFFLQRAVKWVLTPDTRQPIYFSLAVTLQNYFNSYQSPWLHCPHSAVSVDSMSIGIWGQPDADVILTYLQDYNTDVQSDPARVQMLSFEEFDPDVDHLTIGYTSGYGTTPSQIPMAIWQGVLLLTMRLWEQRGEQDGVIWSSGAEALLAPYMALQFGGSSDLYNA